MSNYNLTQADLDQLSDTELQQLANNDFNSLSDEKLNFLSSRHELNTKRNLNQSVNKDGSRHINVSSDMHPEIGAWDRFVVKNFASNPEAQLGYMKKKYPGLEFDKLKNGELVARNKDEVNWKRLDEKGFGIQDLTDIGADTAQGVAEAAALGTGTLATLPVGGWGGLAARSGVGVASESLKQGIGSALGIPNNLDMGNLAVSGVASTAIPAIGENVIKPAWGRIKQAAPVVGEWLSGVPRDVLGNIHTDEYARRVIKDLTPDVFANNAVKDMRKGFDGTIDNIGKDINSSVGGQINMSGPKQSINNALNMLPAAEQANYSQAKNVVVGAGDMVSPADAFRYKNELYKLGQKGSTPSNVRPVATDASIQIRNELERNATDPAKFTQSMTNYAALMDTMNRDTLRPFKKNGDKPLIALSSWYEGAKSKDPALKEARTALSNKVKGYTKVDLDKSARELASYKYFNDPSKTPAAWGNAGKGAGIGGTMGMGLGWGLSGHAMGGAVGGTAGSVLGAAATSPWAMLKMANGGKRTGEAGEFLADKLYKNKYISGDKVMLNLMSNENNR